MTDITVEADVAQQIGIRQFPLPLDEIVQKVLAAKSYSEVSYYMARIMGVRHLVDLYSFSESEVKALRQTMLPLWNESHLWKWALEKPYGYAGDFVALELLYDDQEHHSSSEVGKYLDRWLLDSQLGFGVRERKNILSAFIDQFCRVHHSAFGRPLNILSVASGSARELRDLSEQSLNQMNMTLVDLDPRALEFASAYLPEHVRTLQANALRLKPGTFEQRFELIYSFGFFDYLKDSLIIRCLNMFKQNLTEGGSILFPLKIDSKFRHWFYDLLLDWRFVKREVKDGFALASEAGLEVVEIIESENESVVFFHCVAKG